MNKFIFTITLVLISIIASAQSWQWGKRGGATDVLNVTGNLRQEEVYGIVTDSQKNIYILSTVGKNGLNIDGVIKTNYGDNNQLTDVTLTSFACDGTYRWSKIIGGNGYDLVNAIQIDALDNIYIAGKFGSCGDAAYPPRIENDVILSQTPIDCSVIFLAKYNSNGVLQWFKRPQPAGTSQNDGLNSTFSKGFALDTLANSYWLVQIPLGVYAEGAFTNTIAGNTFYIFKYDANGVFISATPIDMQISTGFNTSLQFARNLYNGFFYLTSIRFSNTNTAIVGGQTITHTAFIACFNELGQFQWVREDTGTTIGAVNFYNLAFDNQNNIYIGGLLAGFSATTFLGLVIPEPIVPGFIMKVNPTATSLIWSSYNNTGTLQRGAIALNGNEIGYTSYCAGTNFTWGTQTLNASGNNQGTEALLARFNKTTGACIQLTKIPGNVGYDDAGTALAVDSSGDYILGGGTAGTLTFATNTTVFTGSQSDFFIAKYATSPCSLATEEFFEEGLLLYPNPAETFFSITTSEKLNYSIYGVTGNLIQQGNISPENNNIDITTLAAGCYIVNTKDENGGVKRGKLIKK